MITTTECWVGYLFGIEQVGDSFLNDVKMEVIPKPPLSANTFFKCVNEQINYWGDLWGGP